MPNQPNHQPNRVEPLRVPDRKPSKIAPRAPVQVNQHTPPPIPKPPKHVKSEDNDKDKGKGKGKGKGKKDAPKIPPHATRRPRQHESQPPHHIHHPHDPQPDHGHDDEHGHHPYS